jgi:hypothetical protein
MVDSRACGCGVFLLLVPVLARRLVTDNFVGDSYWRDSLPPGLNKLCGVSHTALVMAKELSWVGVKLTLMVSMPLVLQANTRGRQMKQSSILTESILSLIFFRYIIDRENK